MAKIKTLTTVTYKGRTYQMGQEYTVELNVAYALGSSVQILEEHVAPQLSVDDMATRLKARNSAITNKDKTIKKKYGRTS